MISEKKSEVCPIYGDLRQLVESGGHTKDVENLLERCISVQVASSKMRSRQDGELRMAAHKLILRILGPFELPGLNERALNLMPDGTWLPRPESASPVAERWAGELWRTLFGFGPADLFTDSTPEQSRAVERLCASALPPPELAKVPLKRGRSPSSIFVNEKSIHVGGKKLELLSQSEDLAKLIKWLVDNPHSRNLDAKDIFEILGKSSGLSSQDIKTMGKDSLRRQEHDKELKNLKRRLQRWNDALEGKYFEWIGREKCWRVRGRIEAKAASRVDRRAARDSRQGLRKRRCQCLKCQDPFQAYKCPECESTIHDACPACHAEHTHDIISAL
jgi:hypothetical protein